MTLKPMRIEVDNLTNLSHYLPLLELTTNEKSLVGIYVIHDQKFVFVNQRLADIFGYSQEEMLNIEHMDSVISPLYREIVKIEYQKRLNDIPNEAPHELMIVRKSGETRWVEILGIKTTFNNRPAVAGFLIDIHHRKRLETEREYTRYQLGERVKELTTLYKTGRLVNQEERSTEEILTEIVNILPGGWQYPEITEARISIGQQIFQTKGFKKFEQHQVAQFELPDNLKGEIDVGYKQNMPVEFEGAFLNEERNLINMLAEIIRVYLTRVHERDVLKKSEANLRTIFDHTEVGHLLLNKDFTIVSFNKPFNTGYAEAIGLKVKVGDSLPDLLPEKNRLNALAQMNQVMDSGKVISYETKYLDLSGGEIHFWVTIVPVKNQESEIIGISLSAQDITERKKMEAELADYNIRLEKEVARQTRELQIANQELDTFNYSISHDIRIPLRAIEMFSEVMQGTTELSEKQMEFMAKIDSCADQMKNMISTLLEFARVSKLSLKKEKVDLEMIVKECTETLAVGPLVEINISLKELSVIYADKVLLGQVMMNLLSNAVKYSSKKKKPVIHIEGSERNGFIEVCIKDNGAGFDAKQADQLFQPFSRLHSSSEFEGNGAGLSIVERIISRHGGKVWAKGSKGKGASFFFTLPTS